MKKYSLIWLYLGIVFLVLSLVSLYFSFYAPAALFLGLVLLNLVLLFFDCKKNRPCRYFASVFTKSLAFIFLLLFAISIAENFYSFIPFDLISAVISNFIWIWPILFIIFFLLGQFFTKLVKMTR